MSDDIFTPDEGDAIVVATDAEGGEFRRPEDELAGGDDQKSIKESVESLFEGIDLSPEFRNKVSVVFEAALNDLTKSKLAEQAKVFESKILALEEGHKAALEEQAKEFDQIVESASSLYEQRMATEMEETLSQINENLETYMEHAVSEWRTENAVAIESGLKVHMAESLMSGLKSLFESHNIDVSEETVDTVAALEEEVASYRKRNNDVLSENIRLAKQNKALMAENAFREMTEGLTMVQAARLRELSENLEVDDISSFKTNVAHLRESFITKERAPQKTSTVVDTFVESTEAPKASQLNEHSDIRALAEMMKGRNKR